MSRWRLARRHLRDAVRDEGVLRRDVFEQGLLDAPLAEDAPRDVVREREPVDARRRDDAARRAVKRRLWFGRIVVSQIDPPIMLVNLT